MPKNSYVCSCPWPEPTLDAVDKDTKAGAQPYCVRICNGPRPAPPRPAALSNTPVECQWRRAVPPC